MPEKEKPMSLEDREFLITKKEKLMTDLINAKINILIESNLHYVSCVQHNNDQIERLRELTTR